jgi:hypothetical protein
MRKIVSLALIALSLSSCSVIMAAKKSGTDLEQLQSSKTRGEFISAGAQVISSERFENGELVEVYQYKKATGSTGRALMHGLLDVWTLGIWEVVGTPMEGYMNKSEYFTIRVTYNQDNIATRVEIL